MLKSLYIRNFRGIKEAEIEELIDVNIFIGRNGVGKSSILEAIYLASSWAEPMDPIREEVLKANYIITRRSGRGDWDTYRDVIWYAKDVKKDIEIILRFASSKELRLKTFYETTKLRSPVWFEASKEILSEISGSKETLKILYYTLDANVLWDPEIKGYSTSVSPNVVREKVFERFREEIEFLRNTIFLDNKISVKDVEERIWRKILDNRLDKVITNLVKEEYEPNVENIIFKPTKLGKYALALALPKTTIEIDALGDGIRNAIFYASALSLAENTIALIEDPEVHQHPGGMATLMRFILRTSKERRLQLFITTQSIELINIVRRICEDLGLRLRIFFVEKDYSTDIVSIRILESIDVEHLQKLGLDPRLLYLL
jgi:AAA15 family ATPase/GTPase